MTGRDLIKKRRTCRRSHTEWDIRLSPSLNHLRPVSHLPKINKILALLTTGILVTLLGALELAGWYVKHDFFNPVKGEPNDHPEFIFYTPAIVLTLALLLLLLFSPSAMAYPVSPRASSSGSYLLIG